MDKDLQNFKKWFRQLGLEMDGKINDEVLKKLMPPQRRDMWRHIIKHVRPKEEVDLIKKSLLLHKLQKRQKPLMSKVESYIDLSNALKYEELITKYNKIQKEIIDAKINNNKLKMDLNEKIEHKRNVIKNIENKQDTSYLANHKIEYYNEFIKMYNELSNFCDHFSRDANNDLTKSDYEDSLIICCTEVDDAKQAGVMNDGVNIGKKLCNAIYSTTCDKSPAVLLQTVEENLKFNINKSNDTIIEANYNEPVEHNKDNTIVYDEVLKKLFEKQLELESNLSNSITEKEHVFENLKKATHLVKNEVISQYKLKNISCTEHELQVFKKNVMETFQMWFKNSLECSNVTVFQENVIFKDESLRILDEIVEKTNTLNEEINQKKIIVGEMLKELNDKKSDFGLMETKTVMDNLAENYLNTNNDSNLINKMVTSIKTSVVNDVNNMNKLTIRSTPRLNYIHLRTLKDMKQHSEIIDIICEKANNFEQFNIVISTENSFNEIIQKENIHKSEFESIISQMEKNITELKLCIEDSKLVANILLTKKILNSSAIN
ncbi:dynein heavy chain-like protein 2 [Metopolophium dirhodum]|uniref:dynein heavy chain-like protein 2 n=1 Tax=Metopolophium dirhodum TaxID=44670 RepID=UPI00298FA30B|nr:dynein heavy chain-like protein 2 [Metopolophium dirhodum]